MYKVTLQFETCKPSYKGKSLWTLTKEFNDLRHCDNFIAQICRTKGYLLDECWYDSGFPFNEGDTYYTIEDNEVVMSYWDYISEELFDKNKLYFVSKTEAQKYITQKTNKIMRTINFKSVEIDGIDEKDYPDFCDAYICYAEWSDGTEMTEQEIEDNFDDDIYEFIENQIY